MRQSQAEPPIPVKLKTRDGSGLQAFHEKINFQRLGASDCMRR